jgi:hypothetical protein
VTETRWVTLDATEAVASVAYRASEAIAIYPITPASPMGEHCDEWSTGRRPGYSSRWRRAVTTLDRCRLSGMVTQLCGINSAVECQLPKLKVASSNLVSRST